MSGDKIRVHVKNNRWAEDTFPNTPEGEEVFTITRERFDEGAAQFPDIASRLDVTIDWDTDNFERSMADAEVLLTWNLPTENLGAVAPDLKWIHCIGAGVEHLAPMDWLPSEVTLTNAKGVHAAKAGEYGLMTVLMLHNHVPALATNQRSSIYDSLYSTPIGGRTLLILGVGSIGGAVAKHASALGLHVIGVTRHGQPMEGVDRMVTPDALDDVLPEADFVFVSTPMTPETANLLDARRLDLMKPTAGIVNVGRAGVIDYDHLRAKLEAGTLGGAILDVFDPEPLPAASPLWSTRNLMVTPHVSADDGASYVPLTLDLFFRSMGRYLDGSEPLNKVRPELGY